MKLNNNITLLYIILLRAPDSILTKKLKHPKFDRSTKITIII